MWGVILAVAFGWLGLALLAWGYLKVLQPSPGSRRRRVAVAVAGSVKKAAVVAGVAAIAHRVASRAKRRPRDALIQHVNANAAARNEQRAADTRLDDELDAIDQAEDAAVAAVAVEDVPAGDLDAEAAALGRALRSIDP